MPHFTKKDDTSLLRSALESPQYKPVVRDVFAKKNADKYFVIDRQSESHQTMYSELIHFFGVRIRAIQAIAIRHIDANHWLIQLINKHVPHMKELYYKKYLFTNIDYFSSQHIKITHLTFRGGYREKLAAPIQLPEYRNWKSIELFNFPHVSKPSQEQELCNNPQMERLSFTIVAIIL